MCSRHIAALALALSLALAPACSDDAGGSTADGGNDASDAAADSAPDRDLADDTPGGDTGTDDADLDASADTAASTDTDADALTDIAPDAEDDATDALDALDAGDTGDAGDDASADVTVDADADVDPGPGCDYPLVWEPEPGIEASVATALTELAPSATLTFSDDRGTIQSANGMNLPVTCADGENLFDALFAILDANPDVFQIDTTEWETPPPLNCVNIDTSNTTLTVLRQQLGPQPVLRDTMALSVRREDGVILFRNFFATYLPMVPDDLAAEMLACRELTLAEARAAVLNTTFPYSTFEMCVPTGSGEYVPNELDVVELDETAHWSWNELADETLGVELVREHFGRLLIDGANVTEMLQASDANCPEEEGPGRVYGFRVTFDAVLRTILSKMPGVGCIVC